MLSKVVINQRETQFGCSVIFIFLKFPMKSYKSYDTADIDYSKMKTKCSDLKIPFLFFFFFLTFKTETECFML